MTTRELKTIIAGLPLHDQAETNVLGLRIERGIALHVETDNSELVGQIDELKTEVANLKEGIVAAEKDSDDSATLKALLDEFRDGTATVLEYRQRAEAAEDRARQAETQCRAALAECHALRKRKGIEAALFKHAREVLAYLHDNPAPASQALVAKLHRDK